MSSLDSVRQAVAETQKTQSYTNLGDAFAHWYLTARFSLSDSEAAEATLIGGPGDKGLDAVWFDDDQRLVLALQAKYSDEGRASFTYEDATKLRSSLEFLQDATRLQSIPEGEFRDRLEDSQGRIRTGYSIQFYIVVFGNATSEARKEIDDIDKKSSNSVQVFLHEIQEVINVLPVLSSTPDIVEDLPILRGELFEHVVDKHRSVVISVSASTLAQLRERHGDRLFDENVRYYLGAKRANSGMVASLRLPDGQKNFWFYHNGITAVGRRLTLNRDKTSVHVEGLQIVNGCQTTVTLHDGKHLYDQSVETPQLLMRIIETEGEDEFLRNISRYTNTQSAVDERDLVSNNRIQQDLQTSLKGVGYFCEIKRGEWKTLPPEEKKRFTPVVGEERRLTNIDLAKAVMCWEGKPTEAKTRKRAHFEPVVTAGFYEEIFKPDRSPSEYMLAHKILEYCEGRRKQLQAELKEKELADLGEEQRMELDARAYLIHAETLLAGYLGLVIRDKVSPKHYHLLVNLIDSGNLAPLAYLFDLVDQILMENVKEKVGTRSFQMSKYYKTQKAWPETRGTITAQLNILKRIAQKDPLDVFVEMLNQNGIPAS